MDFITKEPQGLGIPHRLISAAQVGATADPNVPCGPAPSPATPSLTTAWDFGTFVDVIGPENLTVRLFVPAVR
jgi:hypothetical protein